MKIRLKPLADQVIVITGATSGIGLATARMAAARGARLVLGGRSAEALRKLADEIEADGGQASFAVGDVASEADIADLARVAFARFGGFDTWVNNAGVSAFVRVEDAPLDDMRRLFETNFWGLVLGTREADRHLRSKGGAIINVGSVLSERALALQGFYSASKHAVKGFTDALRSEIDEAGAPVSVTLVKPGPIDTPYTTNGKNFLPSEPQHVPPVYAPETVARAILRAAVKPTRYVTVGGGGAAIAFFGHVAPGLTDRLMAAFVIPGQQSGRTPAKPRQENGLEGPTGALRTRGNYPGLVRSVSFYTELSTRPVATAAAFGAILLLARSALRSLPHRAVRFDGSKGSRSVPKGLRIELEARRGFEDELRDLVADIGSGVEAEPDTRPWFGLRRSKRRFEIFETFANESGRKRHLAGKGAAELIARSNELLERPAKVTRLDVIETKNT